MTLCGAAAVPEQPECGFECQLPLAPLPTAACLQRQALGLSFASPLLLTIMGQLKKRFVMQHCHPSFACEFG